MVHFSVGATRKQAQTLHPKTGWKASKIFYIKKKKKYKYCLAWQMAICSEIPPHLFSLLRKVSRVTAQHGNLSLTLFLSSLLFLTRLLLLIKKHLKTQSKLALVFAPFFLPLLYILLSLSSFCPS